MKHSSDSGSSVDRILTSRRRSGGTPTGDSFSLISAPSGASGAAAVATKSVYGGGFWAADC